MAIAICRIQEPRLAQSSTSTQIRQYYYLLGITNEHTSTSCAEKTDEQCEIGNHGFIPEALSDWPPDFSPGIFWSSADARGADRAFSAFLRWRVEMEFHGATVQIA